MNNFDMMKKRLQFQGGIAQEDRMIEGKRRTFQKTLQYSYQACNVRKIQPYDECIQDNGILYPMYRALINPDKIKQDYDDKILSIDYSTGFQLGDIFEQIPDGQEHQERSNWIIQARGSYFLNGYIFLLLISNVSFFVVKLNNYLNTQHHII